MQRTRPRRRRRTPPAPSAQSHPPRRASTDPGRLCAPGRARRAAARPLRPLGGRRARPGGRSLAPLSSSPSRRGSSTAPRHRRQETCAAEALAARVLWAAPRRRARERLKPVVVLMRPVPATRRAGTWSLSLRPAPPRAPAAAAARCHGASGGRPLRPDLLVEVEGGAGHGGLQRVLQLQPLPGSALLPPALPTPHRPLTGNSTATLRTTQASRPQLCRVMLTQVLWSTPLPLCRCMQRCRSFCYPSPLRGPLCGRGLRLPAALCRGAPQPRGRGRHRAQQQRRRSRTVVGRPFGWAPQRRHGGKRGAALLRLVLLLRIVRPLLSRMLLCVAPGGCGRLVGPKL